MIFESKDYRSIVSATYQMRRQRNPAYSIRAFARDLGLAPSTLSELLRAKHQLSPGVARAVARRLGLNDEEQRFFGDLVDAATSRDQAIRKLAESRIRQVRDRLEGQEIQLDHFTLVADWYHLAILEGFKLKGFRGTFAWIARTFGISAQKAKDAMERLSRLGFIKRGETGGFELSVGRTTTSHGVPSTAVKKFHAQVLTKAQDAVFTQPIDKRDLGTVVMAIDVAKIAAARKRLHDFRQEFAAEFGGGSEHVYALGTQLFQLDTLELHEDKHELQ